ncbi:MAG: nucleotidyl transferase AbiEii/AbiGii toxin family protein [Armatimonadetes bacterium]|nr:nucleotidyl transferase AbiEii/AbiGii toxin family protein [Armatimonadota bacterium]
MTPGPLKSETAGTPRRFRFCRGNRALNANPVRVKESVFQKVLALLTELNRHEVEYKVFGGIALIAHGIVRPTEDIDIFVSPTAENIDRLKRALRAVWDDPSIDEISYDDLVGDYPAVGYGPPDESLGVDILTRLGDAYSYDNVETEIKHLGSIPFAVATPRMLYDMKRDTVRPKDHADAELLKALYDLEDDR